MKIVCDNCGAKYSIADEKVRGKVFKIRCKKCQNIIVVRGTELEGEGAAAGASAERSEGAGEYQETPVWHVVIDREQVGPMTVGEVADRFTRGEISEDTYIWKEGFADWRRLAAVEEFNELTEATTVAPTSAIAPGMGGAGAAQNERQMPWESTDAAAAPAQQDASAPWEAGASFGGAQADASQQWGQEGHSGGASESANLSFGDQSGEQHRDLFATYHGDETDNEGLGAMLDAARASAALSSSPVAGSAPGAGQPAEDVPSEGGSLFPTESSSAPQAESVSAMTGARNENSVLFSLSNLQDLAMGKRSTPVAAADGGEGSGLIDIRSMAGSSGGLGGIPHSDETPFAGISSGLASLGGPVAAAPVLMPAASDEKSKWILPVVIALGVALLGMGGIVLYLALRTPPAPTYVAQAPAGAAAPAAGAPAVAPAVAPAAAGGAVKETSAAGAPAAAPEKKPDEAKAKTEAKAETKTKSSKAAAPARKKVASARRAAPRRAASSVGDLDEPPPSRPRRHRRSSAPRGGKRDALDDLIDGALDEGNKKPRRRRASRSAPAAAPKSNLPETLSRSQIQAGMRGVKGRIQGCFDRYKVPGLASVKVKIGSAGRITSARLKGKFAGTPTGACVLAAARSARFPRFSGTSISVTYPFILK